MGEKKRFWNILQVVFFLLILGAGTGIVVFGACEGKTYSELEKRELAAFPSLEARTLFNGEFESDLTEALSDHIMGRDLFVTAKTAVQILLGKTEIDGIFIDDERLIELYRDSDFSNKQIKSNIKMLTDFMANAANGIGTEHVKTMLIPSKYSLYRDHLPSYMPVSTRADSIAKEIRTALSGKLAKNMSDVGNGESEGDSDGNDDTEDNDEVDETGFDFDEGDPDGESVDEAGFDFDEGDPDGESVDETGFDFDEGDPDGESSDQSSSDRTKKGSARKTDESGFDFDAGDPDGDIVDETGFDFDAGDPDGDIVNETNNNRESKSNNPGNSANSNSSTDGSSGSTISNEKETDSQPADISPEIKEQAESAADKMVVDLRPILAEHAGEYIYYNTDHHWTTLGAEYAYRELFPEKKNSIDTEMVTDEFLGTDYNKIHYYKSMDSITNYKIPEAESATMEINDSGDLSNRASIYDTEALQKADKYDYFFSGNYSAITVKTGANNGKTLLIVKDSYSNSLIPFLCSDYSTIIMVDLRYVNSSIYDYLPAGMMPDDIIIAYNEEKFMQDTHQMYLN